MSTLSELMAQKAAIEKRIADARRDERAATIQKIKSLMAEHGLSAADLSGKTASGPSRKGGKVAPKYRNPATGETWSGRGLQPKWLKAALVSGRKLGDFAL
jgi:DNA-binding protein H-NS